MEIIVTFFITVLTAFAAENAVFARALGLSRPLLFLKSPRAGILYGGVLTWMAVLSSMLAAGVNYILQDNAYIPFVRAPLYFLCVAAVYLFTFLYTRRKLPKVHTAIRPALVLGAFNSALFGALYMSALRVFDFGRTVAYAIGAGAGYTSALLIIYFARKRLAISPVPRSFRGLPVLLVYIGLLSLAICGLTGHALPV